MSTELSRPKRRVRSYMPSTKSMANLIPYKPGQNGHGRVYPLKERLLHALEHPLKEPAAGAPHGDVIVYNTLRGAAELVPVAFRETWDRVEGKVPEPKREEEIRGAPIFNIIVLTGEAKDILKQLGNRLLGADQTGSRGG